MWMDKFLLLATWDRLTKSKLSAEIDSRTSDSDSNSDSIFFKGWFRIQGFPKSMNPIPVASASDSDSNSSVSEKFWFRFWFQHHVIPIPIPIPVFCKFNDCNSNSDSSDVDFDSNPNSIDIDYDFNSESRVSCHVSLIPPVLNMLMI